MKTLKIGVFGLILVAVTIFGFEIEEQRSVAGKLQLVPIAEAKIGRPLTPVSVAGVARRTVRRCAVGVYNCGLFDPRYLDSLDGQISPELVHCFSDVPERPLKYLIQGLL